MAHLVTVIEALLQRQVGFRSLCDGAIDTTTASGELVITLFSALAQIERRLIQERTRAGLAAASARGKTGRGKPLHPDEPRVRMAYTMYADPRLTVADICRTLRISPGSWPLLVKAGASPVNSPSTPGRASAARKRQLPVHTRHWPGLPCHGLPPHGSSFDAPQGCQAS